MYLKNIAEKLSAKKIDDTSNLSNDPVYILGFDRDTYVKPEYGCVEHTLGIFDKFGAKTLREQKDFVHCVPTDLTVSDETPKSGCEEKTDVKFFVSNCGFDAAGNCLKHLLTNLETSPLAALKSKSENWKNEGVLKKFNQQEFLTDSSLFDYTGFGEEGWVYIPNNCIDGTTKKCKLHVNLHGTGMGYASIGDNYFKRAGWLEYAASNDLIMLFPQANYALTNPLGNWDINVPQPWKYTEPWLGAYTEEGEHTILTNQGVQPKAIKAMIDRVISPQVSGIDLTLDAENGDLVGRTIWWYLFNLPYFSFLVSGCFSPFAPCDL